jgi:hypothetical protein
MKRYHCVEEEIVLKQVLNAFEWKEVCQEAVFKCHIIENKAAYYSSVTLFDYCIFFALVGGNLYSFTTDQSKMPAFVFISEYFQFLLYHTAILYLNGIF